MRTALLILLLAPMAAFAQFAPPSILPYTGAPTNNYSLFNQVAFRPQTPMFGSPFQSAFPGAGIGGFYPQQPMYQSAFGIPQFGGMPFGGFPQPQHHLGIGLNFNLGSLLSGLSNIDTSSRANEYDDDYEDYHPRHHRHHHHPRVVEEDDDDGGQIVEERPAVTAAHLSISRAPVVTPFGVRPGASVSVNVIDRQPVYHYADADAAVSRGEHIALAEDDDAIMPPPPVTRYVAPSGARPAPAAARAVTRVRASSSAAVPYRRDPGPTEIIGARPSHPRDQKSAQVYDYVMQRYHQCQQEGYVPSNCVITEWSTFGGRPNRSCHPAGRAMDIGGLRCGSVRIRAVESETAKGKPFRDMVACMKSKMPYNLWHQHHGRGVTLDHYDNFHISLGCHVNGRFVY